MTTGQLLMLLLRDLFGSRKLGGTGTRTLRLHVVVNNLNWPTLELMLDSVRGFYEPVVTLDITASGASMQVPYSTYPDLAPLSVVEYEFYDRFISIPHLADADIVMLLTPRPTTPATYAGIMSFANCGPWETTVFTEKENDHAYVGPKDLGNVNTLLMLHELSHALYRMQPLRTDYDNTHAYFYGGTPERVLEDLHFPGAMSRNEIFSELGRKLVGALVALGIIQKYRTVLAEKKEELVQPQPTTPTAPAGEKLYLLAKASIGTDVSPGDKASDEYACAESLSSLVNQAYGDFPAGIVSTIKLNALLAAHAKFRRVEQGEAAQPGDIAIAVTGQGNGSVENGHTGVIGKLFARDGTYWIMSNNSPTGTWEANYSMLTFSAYFSGRGGFPILVYRRHSL